VHTRDLERRSSCGGDPFVRAGGVGLNKPRQTVLTEEVHPPLSIGSSNGNPLETRGDELRDIYSVPCVNCVFWLIGTVGTRTGHAEVPHPGTFPVHGPAFERQPAAGCIQLLARWTRCYLSDAAPPWYPHINRQRMAVFEVPAARVDVCVRVDACLLAGRNADVE
jgi:hypothetical protein